MKYNNKTFQLKYEAWKNGADYWKDIRGINLGGKAQEDEPSEELRQQIRALVNSILDAYNSGKDDAYTKDIAEDLRPIPFDAPLNHELPKFEGGKPDFYELAADYIIQHEGFLPNATDIGDGVITIGYGTTDPRYAKLGRTISRDAARKLVTNDLRARYSRLSENISRYQDLPDSAKIALLSYDYNYPTSAKRTPRLYAALASGNWQEAAKLMDAGINMKKFGNGLRKRRLSEQRLFLLDLAKALQQSRLVQNMQTSQDLLNNLMALKVTAPPQAATLPTPAARVLTKDTDSQQYNSMAADARNLILEPTPLPNAIQNMLQGNNKGKDGFGLKFWLRRGLNLKLS